MTSLWILSDLHQEVAENAFDPQASAPSDADVVVVAGDVHISLARSIDWLADRLPGVPIVMAPGNHEFWRGPDDRYSLQDVIEAGRECADSRGITLLIDGDCHEIDGCRFVGGTMWTDFALRPGYLSLGGAMSEASKRMNDYRRIRFGGNRSKDRLDPRDTVAMHRATRARIDAALAEPHDGPTVVVTHHAPHPESLGCDPLLFDLPWAYASDMSGIIEERRPELWVHGHLHGRADYVVGETRVLMNARGHVEEPSCRLFDPGFVVEVEARALAPGM